MSDTTMKLTAETVESLFESCRSKTGELIDGIVHKVRLDVTRKEDQILALLKQLPRAFLRSSGAGGWPFLNACDDCDGRQWTGLHTTMEKLVMLGLAAGLASFPFRRDLWSYMPGGMPYFVVEAWPSDPPPRWTVEICGWGTYYRSTYTTYQEAVRRSVLHSE